MKILIIDSHKGTNQPANNLHWLNAKILADYLKAELIWSYPSVNAIIKTGYDIIIYNHASNYSYVDNAWLEKNPNARLFYVSNEYNLGEPYPLWTVAKAGRKYDVIANHPAEASKIVKKYIDKWHIVNLNTLIFDGTKQEPFRLCNELYDCIYYGSFRKGRIPQYTKYLTTENIKISTYYKNIDKFNKIGVRGPFLDRFINWSGNGLFGFYGSLYIEDDITKTYYNHLANRFYEALNYNVVPIFAAECQDTINRSGYEIPKELIISSPKQVKKFKGKDYSLLLSKWKEQAAIEKDLTLKNIKEIINGR